MTNAFLITLTFILGACGGAGAGVGNPETVPTDGEFELVYSGRTLNNICSKLTSCNGGSLEYRECQEGMYFSTSDFEDLGIPSEYDQFKDVYENELLGNLAINNSSSNLKGICVFAAGNQSRVNLNIGANLQGLVYYGVGNGTSGSAVIDEDSGSLNNLLVNLKGNDNSFGIVTNGVFNCSKSFINKNGKGLFSCR